MEVADKYKITLDEILKIIPKNYIKRGPYASRLYEVINSGLRFYDKTNNYNMFLSVLTGENMEIKASGPYFPDKIQHHIKENMTRQLHYTYHFPEGKTVEVYFGLLNEQLAFVYQKYHDMMRLIISWAHVCMKYAFKECSKSHKIYFYLTDFEKDLPENQILTLSQEHINTGVTTRCQPNNETVIYRKEEWFKVYVHEMMHAFGFDISETYRGLISNEIKKMFDIRSSMKVEEAYVEVWARLVNGAYASIQVAENEKDFEQLFLFTMEVERLFSVIQAQKVLGYMNLNYSTVLSKDNRLAYGLYREKTNVFAYYILTAMIMNDPYAFMKICARINKKWLRFDNTVKAVKELDGFIRLAAVEPSFMKNMEKDYGLKNRGLRMSLIEVN